MYIYQVGYEKCSPTKKTVRTIYPHDCVHYIVAGKGFFNGRPLGNGQGFICRKGEIVEYYPDAFEPWEYYWIWMEGEDSGKFFDIVKPDEKGVFHHALHTKLKAFYDLVSEMNWPEHESLRYNAFLKIAVAFHDSDDVRALSVSENYVRLAKQMIADRLGENLSIADIADELHLNRCYLRNLFVRYENMSPLQYKQKVRMEQASQLLKEKAIPIHIVASSVGYDNQLQFSREFKKFFSCSPSEYRKKV